MSNRLAPHMNDLVSQAQSAFIKRRCIHDNFMYVRNLAKRLHRKKTPALLFKLDIKKAFDSVRWDYLLDLLNHLGFPPRFRGWISTLLSSASSRVLLNGVPGAPIKHGCGLRQGDPLSPLLFVLAIDPLHLILQKATAQGKLHPLGGQAMSIRASLYADDAAVFLAPIKSDVEFFAHTLKSFGDVTGLATNCAKSLVAPIRCENLDLVDILHSFPANRTSFPMRYLGLPLSVKNLKRIHYQPLEDKIAAQLAPWMGKHVASPGRVVLVKSVLTAIAIYYMTALNLPVEVMNKIDALRRAFLWAGCDKVTGGKCKINWEQVCKSKLHGGLGILNLKKFASALRIRWLWGEWLTPIKPWVGLGTPCDRHDRDIFAASTKVVIGDGTRATFWESTWLDGLRPKDIAPKIFELSNRKNCSVQKALLNNFWVSQVKTSQGITVEHLQEFVNLWEKLSHVHLLPDTPDSITWKLTKDGHYSAATAYSAQFLGSVDTDLPRIVWRSWAPPKCKFFAWLVINNRIWTADRLQKRGWPNCNLCPLCKQVQESAAHLLFQCRYTVRVWSMIKMWLGLHDIYPQNWGIVDTVKTWWSTNASRTTQSR